LADEALDVLLVHESETDIKLVLRELHSSGFTLTWERVDTASALREALLRRNRQIVISDSSTPRLDVLEALVVAKEVAPEVPFIVVSDNLSEALAVEAMRRGAADCVTKEQLWRLGPAVTRELSEAYAREGVSHRLLVAQEAELRRIARGLHDQFGDLLTAMNVILESVQSRRGSARATALAAAQSLVDEAMSHARNFSVELENALIAVTRADMCLGSAVSKSVPPELRGVPHTLERGSAPIKQLTPRQREVLQLIVEGHSTRKIAQQLRISVKTVETHRAKIMGRLDIHNVASLVHYAIRVGVLRAES
jgi:DNA-binding NarL/FixJ family response regulator